VLVGHAHGFREDERLRLLDLHVEVFPPAGSALPRNVPLRRRGVGSELLSRFLRAADAACVREMWGCVTRDDLRTPDLLRWYANRGFAVTAPDAECSGVKGMSHKVVRRRPT
jgi:hypothetical protein